MSAVSSAAGPQDPDPRWLRLRQLVAERSLKRGRFRLASGRESSVLFDMKPLLLTPEGCTLVADLLLDALREDHGSRVGGLEIGGVLMVQAVCARALERRDLGFFFVRKAAKEHGTKNRIDGELDAGATVVLLEDVTTTGGSIMQAVAAVRERGCRIAKILTILDREEGATENLTQQGIRLIPLFRKSDFLEPGSEKETGREGATG